MDPDIASVGDAPFQSNLSPARSARTRYGPDTSANRKKSNKPVDATARSPLVRATSTPPRITFDVRSKMKTPIPSLFASASPHDPGIVVTMDLNIAAASFPRKASGKTLSN